MALTNLDAQHPTILLVDDDPVVLRIMAKHLKKRGNTVVAADKPLHALKFAEQRGSDIRIVIRDVVMPEMDGCELGARVRAIHPDIPILFVSGQDYGRLQPFAERFGAVNFLRKPFSGTDLCAEVDRILAPAWIP